MTSDSEAWQGRWKRKWETNNSWAEGNVSWTWTEAFLDHDTTWSDSIAGWVEDDWAIPAYFPYFETQVPAEVEPNRLTNRFALERRR